ncbi:unnamed protein product [Cylindrotheca closterium]|uniref:Uncharacterized protein n=1 Tax=Cylindrotheca closterium TaxID=2856 RepID=A0AAD2G2A2_9STRA|nr:unnamed protein product [Cylindrotheca closterium]
MPQEYPRTSLTRQCIRIRLANSVTNRSKNFRLSEKDFDDSVLEKIYETPAAEEVVKWPSEQSQQLEANSSEIQCVMKLENLPDKVFSENELGKTSIQDLLDFQKEDNGSAQDIIQLYLACRPVDEKDDNNNENDENSHHSPTITHPKVLDEKELGNRSSWTMSPPLTSPSILKCPSSSLSSSKRVSFGATIPAHLQAPSFGKSEMGPAVSE